MDDPQIEALLQYANDIIATLRESFLILDKNLQVISANQAFYATFKVVEKDTIGRLLPDLGNKQWAIPKLLLLLNEILPEKKAVKDYQVEHKFEQIGERAMILNACQMRVTRKIAGAIAAGVREAAAEKEEEEGEEDLILLAIEDITERKQVEENIKKLNVELEERVLQRTAELSRAVKELEAFSYSVAHDLKAPLRAMSGFSNILSEDYAPKLDDNGRRVIGVIKDNARDMGQFIDDLLKLSHLLRQAMDIVDIDMTALAQSVCHEFGEELSRGRAEVSVKPLPLARADRTLTKQIFTNLISNAIKFTSRKDSALIEIGGYDKGRESVYYVKDNGAGFDMKYADQLFGVFQRLHVQDEFSGTGIGLAIVSNAVRRLGGTVWAKGETDKGATFYFTLPKGGQDD